MLSQISLMNCQFPPRARNSADGDFFFYVEGLPPYYTWGMLKDLARKAAPFPGWTEMATNPHGMQKGRGWIKIRRPKDAYNLYEFLTTGAPSSRPLKVYLWSTARSPPELLRCNCDIPRSMQPFLPSPPQTVSGYSTPGHQSPVFQHPPPVAPRRMIPTYVFTPDFRPVNATSGLVKTESRGIFISQLDFAIDQRQLEEYLRRIGSFESCEIRRDPTTGRSRGIATAKFATAEAASTAMQVLNGKKLMNKTVKVRFDTETETVASASPVKDWREGPIIANGSK